MSGAVAKMKEAVKPEKQRVTVFLQGEDGVGEVSENREKGDTWFRVEVRSVVKPGLIAGKDIEADSPKLLETIMAAAGACAEYLCERYDGSTIDPAECAKLAGLEFEKLKAHIENNMK